MRILCTDAKCTHNGISQPIVALVADKFNEWSGNFCPNGQYYTSGTGSSYDLINIPEPKKWREWKSGEVGQVPILLRQKTSGPNSWSWQVLSVQNGGLTRADSVKGVRLTEWSELFNNFEHSKDGGQTWQPCGVEE